MGNQQPKDKTLSTANNSSEEIVNNELFSSNKDHIDIKSDLWRSDNLLSEKNNLSSFTSTEVKQTYTVAQSDFSQTQSQSPISVKKGEKLKFKGYSPDRQWVIIEKLDSSEIGWIPSNIISDFIEESQDCDSYLQQFKWYHGAIPRSFAEYLLNSGITGSFLVRESESNRRLRSISLRYEGKIWHFRISKDYNNKYYVTENQRFDTISKLIDYHSKFADGLPCQLLFPAPKRAQATVFGVGENDSADIWEIDRTEIMMKNQLGSGQYGIVYEAFWKKYSITVAVKTVKTDITVADDFLEEARLMKSLQHPNLVRLLGVCTQEPPNYIIAEFMENGNLLEYLRTRSKEDLPPPVLLYMAIQIAAGMEYLEQHNFIHRDLAARNCLVGQDNIVKVADFGLARCMERDDTYTAHVGAKFPIKWTAPEGLAYNQFSTKSDVWAFGVLLWELATYGMTPYPGIELQDVYVYLEKGNIMNRPAGCPDNIYDIMKQCWQWFPESRPSFKDLHNELEKMLSNINEQIDLEIAKESKNRSDVRKRPNNNTNDSLPSPPNHDQLIAQTNNKRKGPPIPPVRTTPLKEMSLTASFTVSNPSIMEDSFIENSDDETLPLPPPEDLLTKNFDSLSLHETTSNPSYRINPNLPPPILKNKPKRNDNSSKSVPLFDPKELASKNSITYNNNNNNSVNHNIGRSSNKEKDNRNNFSYLSLPKSQNASKIPQNIKKDIKRVKSDKIITKPIEQDFQSELRSRLKMQNKDNTIENSQIIENKIIEENPAKPTPMWSARKSMGHMRTSENSNNSDISHNQPMNILTPSNKRMSWTGGVTSLQNTVKKSTNINPLPSLSSSNVCDSDNEDADEFFTKDLLLSKLNSICQELSNIKNKNLDQNNEALNSLIENLEAVHLGSTRYGNSSILSAKIKFKFIEQCTNFNSAIESLRKSLKPYNYSSVTSSSSSLTSILIDLKSLIENS
uniref:Tyrosine-protein kinase n=1 Tax=Schmidtea mediterranea TaxID=79327 RepID=A0A1S6KMF8_SCHMD|nr:hypothetical protein Smed-abl-2 [Schmidtea mediterranea]